METKSVAPRHALGKTTLLGFPNPAHIPQDSSKKLSVPNGTHIAQGIIDMPTSGRRPIDSPVSNARNGNYNPAFSVDSPGKGVQQPDESSGESTPMVIDSVAPSPQMARPAAPIGAGPPPPTSGTKPTLELIRNMLTQTTNIAEIKVRQHMAKAKLEQATNEFNKMQKHHHGYPSIKAARTAKRDIAEKRLDDVNAELVPDVNMQQRLTEELTTLINKPSVGV